MFSENKLYTIGKHKNLSKVDKSFKHFNLKKKHLPSLTIL